MLNICISPLKMLQQLPPLIRDKIIDFNDLLLKNFECKISKNIAFKAVDYAKYRQNDAGFKNSTIQSTLISNDIEGMKFYL